MKVLFVCTGNTCRSPMAAALLQQKICQSDRQQSIAVDSAGLAAFSGQAASDYAKQVMLNRNIDLTEHHAKLLTDSLLAAADIVLTMTQRHKFSIVNEFPVFKDKVYTLGEYIGHGDEIIDPFGRDCDAYEFCAAMLAEQINLLWNKLK